MRKFLTAAAAALAFAAVPAMAQTQVYGAPTDPNGNQSWTGSLGLNFTVNGPIQIFSLGAFDDDLDGITNVTVGIYTSGGVLVSPLVSITGADGTGTSGNPFVFEAVTPFILGPGSYQLAAWGFGSGTDNFNVYGPGAGPITFDSLGGRLTATGTSYNNPGVTGFAGQNADFGALRYGSASFIAAAIPEPGTWAMMIGGFGLVGFGMRGRRKRDLLTA